MCSWLCRYILLTLLFLYCVLQAHVRCKPLTNTLYITFTRHCLFPVGGHLQCLFSQHHPPRIVQCHLCPRCQDVLQGDDGQRRTGQHRGKVSLQGHCCRMFWRHSHSAIESLVYTEHLTIIALVGQWGIFVDYYVMLVVAVVLVVGCCWCGFLLVQSSQCRN